jgi:exodeoxyribonuclease V alpha subunit
MSESDSLFPPQPRDPAEAACVEGVLERIVYENEEQGFLVGRLRTENVPPIVTFVGNLLAVSPGETVRLWGRWVDDKRFGRQLRVERYETLLPSSADAIEKYLGSGLVEGIGPAYAKRLVDAFGVETLRVIDEQPERLRSVQGIGPKRAGQIREAWDKQRSIQSIMLFLQGHGIGVSHAVRIYKRYGDSAVTVLRENPYRLADDIHGIAFKTADKIARRLGIAKDSPKRAQAGLLHVLERAAGDGHMFVPREDLITQAMELLEAGPVDAALKVLVERRRIVVEGEAVYLRSFHEAEAGCATQLKQLASNPRQEVPINVEKAIEWIEKKRAIELSPEQKDALRAAVDAKVMVITGGPGTGKTTLVNSIVTIFETKGLFVQLAAPTGRAAKRMEEATGHEAQTLHRLLEFSPKDGGFLRNENNLLECEVLVVDETSMMDTFLFQSLLKAVHPFTRLFLVGDVDQLPSVGPGNVLLDVIASQAVPVAWLKTVFRQAAQSGIVANAHRINRGLYPEFNTTDFFLIERSDPAQALETVVEVVTKRLPRKFGFDPVRDIQVLAPMHRGDAGVTNLNASLQAALNPDGGEVPRKGFKTGDKVMQLRNNYDLDVYNGDLGIIRRCEEETKTVEVVFDERSVLYGFEDLDELSLAYAATVHKSQGSEYPAVVVPVLSQHFLLLQRNVIYTAVTRAGKVCVLVGDPKSISYAIHNDRIARRNTRLADRLRPTAEDLG